MERDFKITLDDKGRPMQTFNGKEYRLYPGERYFNRGRVKMHIAVWKHFNGEIPEGHHIHHKDENSWNNELSNLECIEAFEHLSKHGKKKAKENPEQFKEWHAKGVEAAKDWHKSEEGLEWHREHGKKSWENREYKERTCVICGDTYETRHSGVSKYCSGKCKAQAYRNRQKERQNEKEK